MAPPDELLRRLPDLDIAVPPRGNATLQFFIHAIADQVAAKVRAGIMAQLEHAPRVQPMLLDVKDAAIYLGRSEQSIQHLIFDKELPVVRVGRRVHLDRRDLDAD